MTLTTTHNKDGERNRFLVGANSAGDLAVAATSVDENGVYVSLDDFSHRIVSGQLAGYSVVHKFGTNHAISVSTFTPVTEGGLYRTPQVSGATALRVKAGDVADTAAGNGAREVTLIGLDETGAQISETLATAGALASASTSATFIRLFRIFVSSSGTYATQTVGSHVADVVVENAAGTEDWAQIVVNGLSHGQSQIGAYSVPLGKTAYVTSLVVQVDSTKKVDLLWFRRDNILRTAAPYSALTLVQELIGLQGAIPQNKLSPAVGPFPALTDFGFMARADTQTAGVSVDFSIVLVDD